MTITIEITPEARAMLRELRKRWGDNEAQTLQYVVSSIVNGVRQPRSWERGVVVQLFGEEIYEAEKHIPDVYKGAPYR